MMMMMTDIGDYDDDDDDDNDDDDDEDIDDDNDDDNDHCFTASVRADPALDLFQWNLGNCKHWVTQLLTYHHHHCHCFIFTRLPT